MNENSKVNIKICLVRIRSTLLSILIVFIFVCTFLFFIQDLMIFHGVHDPASRQFLQGRQGFREVMFTAKNGITYQGMMYVSGPDQTAGAKTPLIIYFGGNGEVSYSHMRMRQTLNHWRYFTGSHYLFVDYPGYGLNTGRTHYRNIYEQALAVFDYALSLPYVDTDRIVVMGFSLGTGSAVYLAANRPVAGLILVAPFANGYDLYNNVLPIFFGPMRMLVRQKFPSDLYAPCVTCPVLIIASRSDEIIPFRSSLRLSKLFSGNVDFMELNNFRHNFIFQAEGIYDRIQSFLETIL